MKKPRTKLGRPMLPEGEAKITTFSFRLSHLERAAMAEAARKSGLSVSNWARIVLMHTTEVRDRN